jgi:Spy/CpxP family protein refolding chaperone
MERAMARLSRLSLIVWPALAAAAFALPAMAQPRAEAKRAAAAKPMVIQGPPSVGYEDPTMLLRLPQVQEELDLSAEQKSKLNQIEEETRRQVREQWGALRDLSPAERQAKYAQLRKEMADRAKEVRKKVEAVLLPPQAKRLEQIGIQLRLRWRGVNGIAQDPVIARQLDLTPEQQQKLERIADQTRKKLQELPRQIMEEARKQAMDLLTPQQRHKLEETIGKKFELRWEEPRAGASGGATKVQRIQKKD